MKNRQTKQVDPEVKAVELPDYSRVPRWLVIQGEMDYRIFILKKMLADDKKKSLIHKMIDGATGFDKQLKKEAQELIAECRWLKREYNISKGSSELSKKRKNRVGGFKNVELAKEAGAKGREAQRKKHG